MTAEKIVPLGDVASVERFSVQPADIRPGTMYVGLEDIESGGRILGARPVGPGDLASTKFTFTESHVLYGKLRPYLAKIAAPDFAGICSTDIVPVLPGPLLDRRYLLHFLRQPTMVAFARARSVGINLPRLSPSVLETFPVPLPPLPEQRRIADILDQADGLRAKRRAAVAQLDTLAQTIFLDLFGDPITNPRKWPETVLGDLLTFQQYGPRFYNEAYSVDGIRVIRITDLSESGELDFSKMPRQAVTSEERAKYTLQRGDLIFARTGATVGKVALIHPDDPECIAGAYFITMRFDQRVNSDYMRSVLASPSIRSIVAKQSRQAAQQNFSGPALRRLPVPLPPLDLQLRLALYVNETEAVKRVQLQSLAQMDDLIDSLRNLAFRGEL
jgi:type I restriction enzyme S subunit